MAGTIDNICWHSRTLDYSVRGTRKNRGLGVRACLNLSKKIDTLVDKIGKFLKKGSFSDTYYQSAKNIVVYG